MSSTKLFTATISLYVFECSIIKKEVLTEFKHHYQDTDLTEEWINRFESDHHHIRRKAIEALRFCLMD